MRKTTILTISAALSLLTVACSDQPDSISLSSEKTATTQPFGIVSNPQSPKITESTESDKSTTSGKEVTTTRNNSSVDQGLSTTGSTAKSVTTNENSAADSTDSQPISNDRTPYGLGDVGWERVETDDFNGNKLEDNSWEVGWWGSFSETGYNQPVNNKETACYHDDQVKVSGGQLSLTMRPTTAKENADGVCRQKDGSPAYFVSGYATSRDRYQIQPGTYIETRMFMPGEGDTLYNWPGFWTTDMDKTLGQWPYSGEFDIAEILQGQACGNYHYSKSVGSGHLQTGKRCTTLAANQWHIFGMKWNKDGSVEYYHGGKRVQDRGGGDWEFNPLELAGPFARNYSHNIALQFGMPQPDSSGYKEPTVDNQQTVKFDYVDVYKL